MVTFWLLSIFYQRLNSNKREWVNVHRCGRTTKQGTAHDIAYTRFDRWFGQSDLPLSDRTKRGKRVTGTALITIINDLLIDCFNSSIYSHRGNGYRWPSNAFATIVFGISIPFSCLYRSFFGLSFLVADTQLYKRLCPSVRLLVRLSVGPSIRDDRVEQERVLVFVG